MWSYYGSKTNVVNSYPHPIHSDIEECFAGYARYSLRHFEKNITLTDKYKVVTDLWKWLQLCSPHDILSLPRPIIGQTLNDFKWDCIEAKHLMGFIIQYGVASPGITPTALKFKSRGNFINYTLNRISKELFKIKHWTIIEGSYEDRPMREATWFVDPPYQIGGHKYKHSNKKIDFSSLGRWCQELPGQVIVCENMEADWLPFVKLKNNHTQVKESVEAIWTNYHTHFNNEQQVLSL